MKFNGNEKRTAKEFVDAPIATVVALSSQPGRTGEIAAWVLTERQRAGATADAIKGKIG